MKQFFFIKAFLAFFLFLASFNCFAETLPPTTILQPTVNELTIEQKRSLRVILLDQMLDKYRQQQVFVQMQQYMDSKLSEKEKTASTAPDVLIKETLDKTRSVYEKVQPFIGNKFKRNYNPEQIEASIDKYAWLKGPCFLILGIREEHKVALSFFYLPGNEDLKHKFLRDAVQYSYPEVLNVPENQTWFESMDGVMDRLAYKFFNIDKYIDPKPNS